MREEERWLITSRSRYRDNSFSLWWHLHHHNLCASAVCPLSQMRPCLAPAPGLCPMLPASPNLWRVESESDTKYESCMKGWRLQPSSSCPLHASFLMDYESCGRHSSCFFVLGSIVILIFAQMKVNVDHQTPDFDQNGAWDKGHNAKLM